MTDLALDYDAQRGRLDLARTATGDLATDPGVHSAVLLSLMAEALARPDDPLPPEATGRGGWWGDVLAEAEGDSLGSRLWIEVPRAKQSAATERAVVAAAEQALERLRREGRIQQVSVRAATPRRGVLALDIAIDGATIRLVRTRMPQLLRRPLAPLLGAPLSPPVSVSSLSPMAEMFARLGGIGVAVDPLSAQHVFADTAGDTQAGTGGQVARIDSIAGVPASFRNSTSTQQPVLRADGLEFDGVDDSLSYPDDPALRFGTTDFTVAFAVKLPTVSGYSMIWDKRGIGSRGTSPGWGLRRSVDRLLMGFDFPGNTLDHQPIVAAGVFSTGELVYGLVRVDRAASTITARVNGADYPPVTIGAGDISGTLPLTIGATALGTADYNAGTVGRLLAIDKLLSPEDTALVEQWLQGGGA